MPGQRLQLDHDYMIITSFDILSSSLEALEVDEGLDSGCRNVILLWTETN
jgi:hypothetical protein